MADDQTTTCNRCKGGRNPPDQGGTTCLRCYNTGSDPQTTSSGKAGYLRRLAVAEKNVVAVAPTVSAMAGGMLRP